MESGKQLPAVVNNGEQLPAVADFDAKLPVAVDFDKKLLVAAEDTELVPINGKKKSTETGREIEQELYEKLKARGEKSMDAYVMASANVSKKDAKKMAEDLAMDAIEQWQKEEDAKLGNGIAAIPGKIVNSIKRGFKLDSFNKENQAKVAEDLEDETALADRAAEAYLAGAENEDTGVKNLNESEKISFAKVRRKKLADLTAEEKTYRMVGKFAEKVAKSTEADDAKIDKEKMKILDNIRALNKKGAIKSDNYAKVLDQMQNDLKGSLAQEIVGDRKKANAAIKALDRYLQDNFTIVSADVEVGLSAKQAYSSLQDKNILKYGALVGSAIGLGSAVISGMSKNKIINTIFGAAPAASVARVAVAGALGGAAGFKTKENAQIRENVREALNMNAKETTNEETAKKVENKIEEIINKQKIDNNNEKNNAKNKIAENTREKGELKNTKTEKNGDVKKSEKDKNKFDILNVDQKIAEMNSLIGENGKLKNPQDFRKATALIAELKARNTLQNKEHVQLLGFNGRENVEKSKLEMFKTINRLKKAAVESSVQKSSEFVAKIIELKTEQVLNGGEGEIGLQEQINKTLTAQKKERLDAAVKGAVMAAGTAAMFEVVRNWGAIRESMGFKQEKVVPPETIKQYNSKSLIMTEGENNQVKAFGFDMNNDGVLNAEKGDVILRGEGFNLTNEQDFTNLRAELRENYHIDLEKQAIFNNKYGEVAVGDYLKDAKNAIEQDINKVNWSKSATKVAFSNPFATSADSSNYQVSVWGLNGGQVPEGAKLYIDLDGAGSGKALEFAIKDGKAIIPADIVDVNTSGNGGMASFIGMARVGEANNGEVISYAGHMGKEINLADKIFAQTTEKGYSFTAWSLNKTGDHMQKISQFAVSSDNQPISNMSEIFDGVVRGQNDNLPMTFLPNNETNGSLALKSGEIIKKHSILGGYHKEFDSSLNTAFYDGGNSSYLGTALKFEVNNNGGLNAENEANVIRQMFVRTATNPYTLGQNASNYGILEPNTLAEKIFKGNKILMENNLKTWGITDGVIDSERDLDLFMRAMKQNPIYWDRLANETLNEMQKELANGGLEVAQVTDRISTYANKGMLDTGRATSAKTVFYPYKIEDDQKVYVGNKGWWVKKWQDIANGKVGDVAVSNQKCIAKNVVRPAMPQQTVAAVVEKPSVTAAALPGGVTEPSRVVVGQPPISAPMTEVNNYRVKPAVSPIINTFVKEEVGPGVNMPNTSENAVVNGGAFSEFLN